MKESQKFAVHTSHGEGILEQIYLSELGHVMARVLLPKEGIKINYNIKNISELLINSEIDLIAY